MSRTIPFVVIRAVTAAPRSESLNIGLVAWNDDRAILLLDHSPSRLRALHPNLARLDLHDWSARVLAELRMLGAVDLQIAMLSHLVSPFMVDSRPGLHSTESSDVEEDIRGLFERLVSAPPATIRPNLKKRRARLDGEIRTWLRGAKLYSSRVEDLSRGRVVGQYPVDPVADLYVDFALKNGAVHVIETLDLRDISSVTPSVRGDVALKSITLSEAAKVSDIGRRVALVHANDDSIAKPALRLIDRYADEVWHMGSSEDRQAFSRFISDVLHADQLSF